MPFMRLGRRPLNLRSLTAVDRIQLLLRLPSIVRLSYYLFRDPRVPVINKAITAAAIVFIISPIDVPNWVPFLGQAADIFFTVNVLELFIRFAPRQVAQEHIAALGLQGKIKL